jgi:hypothetical protein
MKKAIRPPIAASTTPNNEKSTVRSVLQPKYKYISLIKTNFKTNKPLSLTVAASEVG